MKVADVVSSLKTYLKALTWLSDDGEGNTGFKDVFTYPNYSYDGGYPFVVITDSIGSGESLSNKDISFETVLVISICVNWAIIDKQDDDLKREEAMLRIREAWDYLKTQLFKVSTADTIGVDWSYNPSFQDLEVDEFNLIKRDITLIIKENIGR